MSRFVTRDKHGNEAAYGLDHALGYFLDIYGRNEETDDMILELSNYMPCGGVSRNKIIEAMDEHGIVMPERHRRAIVLDLPFDDPRAAE